MKKALALVLTMCMVLALGSMAVSANEPATPDPLPTDNVDWVITEISPDQQGDGTGGWSDGKDCMEFIEIYNNSGRTLNLYDYCITYNGNSRTDARFETQIVEITPLKPGNFLDGTNLPWSGQPNECSDLSNLPVNPDTCLVEPGEVVVLWSYWHESAYAMWNDGKGLSVEDFRAFWNIPDNVKVIAYDAFSTAGYAGISDPGGLGSFNIKNFNIKNSNVGTYGIALYTDVMNEAANTVPDGTLAYEAVYTDCPELAAWATIDYPNQIGTSIANMTFNFTIDKYGFGAQEWGLEPDARRMLLCEVYAEPTVGTLTTFQKLTLGVELEAGEKFEVNDTVYYFPIITELGKFTGVNINGSFYPVGSTFTASSAGKYEMIYVYGESGGSTTEPPVTSEEPPVTTEEPPVTTEEPSTEAPKQTEKPDVTTKAPDGGKDQKGGCGSVVGMGLLAALIPAAVIISKKKK